MINLVGLASAHNGVVPQNVAAPTGTIRGRALEPQLSSWGSGCHKNTPLVYNHINPTQLPQHQRPGQYAITCTYLCICIWCVHCYSIKSWSPHWTYSHVHRQKFNPLTASDALPNYPSHAEAVNTVTQRVVMCINYLVGPPQGYSGSHTSTLVDWYLVLVDFFWPRSTELETKVQNQYNTLQEELY